ncbi:hypothetical protein F5Y14DRAFT_321150 [Nemania sp. NC0429]|nr:hypothetical protein F5Y14DRAFT_321150 [Nemania sp. NC0429]
MSQNAQSQEISLAEIQRPPPAYTEGNQTLAHQDIISKDGPAPVELPAHITQDGNPGGYVSHSKPQATSEGDQRMVTPLTALTAAPTWIDCPFCHTRARTKTEEEGQGAQMCCGFVLCLIFLPLACIPCLFHLFEKTVVSCSACNRAVATIHHEGPIELHAPDKAVQRPSQYQNGPTNPGNST